MQLALLKLKNNYETLAEAVVKSLVEYIGANYTSNTQNNLYTVKSGDTLWNIAKKYDITVNELKQLNNLSSNSLKIGQKLKIPNLEELEGNTYIVKFGDTLYSIANKYNISVDELKKINNLVFLDNEIYTENDICFYGFTASEEYYRHLKKPSVWIRHSG